MADELNEKSLLAKRYKLAGWGRGPRHSSEDDEKWAKQLVSRLTPYKDEIASILKADYPKPRSTVMWLNVIFSGDWTRLTGKASAGPAMNYIESILKDLRAVTGRQAACLYFVWDNFWRGHAWGQRGHNPDYVSPEHASCRHTASTKEASVRHVSGIDAFLGDETGGNPGALMRDELGLPTYEHEGIRGFLADETGDGGPPIDFSCMGLTASGMANPFLEGTLPNTIKVASIDQLFARGFLSSSGDMSHLVHKSDRDLWRLSQTTEGYVVERLFDDAGNPLKG
jgi:hypothetical protein